MTNDKLLEAVEALRKVDPEAADIVGDLLDSHEKLAETTELLAVWETVAAQLAKVVAAYQRMSPN